MIGRAYTARGNCQYYAIYCKRTHRPLAASDNGPTRCISHSHFQLIMQSVVGCRNMYCQCIRPHVWTGRSLVKKRVINSDHNYRGEGINSIPSYQQQYKCFSLSKSRASLYECGGLDKIGQATSGYRAYRWQKSKWRDWTKTSDRRDRVSWLVSADRAGRSSIRCVSLCA